MFSVFMLQYFLFFCPLPHLGRVMLPLPPPPPRSLQLMDALSSESAETEENSKLGLRLIWQGMSIGAPSYLLRTILVCLTRCCDIYILNLIKIRPVREYNLERTRWWYLILQTTASWQSIESTSYREPLGDNILLSGCDKNSRMVLLTSSNLRCSGRPALYSDAKLRSSGTKNQENEWCHRSSKKK